MAVVWQSGSYKLISDLRVPDPSVVKAIQNMRSERLNRGRLAEGEVLQDESLMASGEQPNQPKPAE